MTIRRLIGAIASVALATGGVVSAAASPPGDWIESGFDAANSHHNPKEHTLSTANVSELVDGWNTAEATSTAPVLVNGHLYVEAGTAVNAYSAASGELEWSFPTGAANGFDDASVVVVGGVLYAVADTNSGARGNLFALDPATGAKLWSLKVSAPLGRPLVAADGVVYEAADNRLVAIDTVTRTVRWTFTAPDGPGRDFGTLARPAIANGLVYVSSGNHNLYALDAATGGIAWHYLTGDEILSSPTIAKGIVYVGSKDGNTYALDATNGAVKWSHPTAPSYFVTDVAVAGGSAYFGSENGTIYAVNATTGAPLWKFKTKKPIVTDPVVANGIVYASSYDKNLYALDAATGAKLWSFVAGGSPIENIVVSNGSLYAGFPSGHLRTFHLPTAS